VIGSDDDDGEVDAADADDNCEIEDQDSARDSLASHDKSKDGAEGLKSQESNWIDKRALSSASVYTDDLMYLDDRFQEIALILRIAFARQQKVTKQARGGDDAAAGAGAYDRPRIFNVKEMEGKLRLASSKIAARLAATAAAGLKPPRLEELKHRLALDAFEVNVVVYLAGVIISPTIKSIIADHCYENRQATTGLHLLPLSIVPQPLFHSERSPHCFLRHFQFANHSSNLLLQAELARQAWHRQSHALIVVPQHHPRPC
jgi:hypothetical protein